MPRDQICGMKTSRPFLLSLATLVLASALLSCDRSAKVPAKDTSAGTAPPQPETNAADAGNPGWNSADGPVLLVAVGSAGEAHVIAPEVLDAAAPPALRPGAPLSVQLLARDGRHGPAQVTGVQPARDPECVAWPLATLREGMGVAPRGWLVGFAGAGVTPIAMDSVEAMTHADSGQLATELARLASSLRDDTVASFRGLPFVVREMRRFQPAAGIQGVVADIARSLATEANPREERIFLIAERADAQPWHASFRMRASGAEDSVLTGEPLVIARMGDGRVVMVVGLENGATTRFMLLQRAPDGTWRVQWRSAETDC